MNPSKCKSSRGMNGFEHLHEEHICTSCGTVRKSAVVGQLTNNCQPDQQTENIPLHPHLLEMELQHSNPRPHHTPVPARKEVENQKLHMYSAAVASKTYLHPSIHSRMTIKRRRCRKFHLHC